jgi:hypothetical protein
MSTFKTHDLSNEDKINLVKGEKKSAKSSIKNKMTRDNINKEKCNKKEGS